MMTSLRPRHAARIWALAVVCGALAAGCGRGPSAIELISYQDPYFPEHRRVVFDDCAYRVDADGDLHIVGRAGCPDEDTGGGHSEFIHAHVFWQPKPGVTFANKTTTTATIHYVISYPQGTAVYTGTGFVYPKKRRGERLTAAIETGQLRLAGQTGNPAKTLGDTRLNGTLHARLDPHATTDLMRTIDLYVAGEQ